MDHKQTAIYLDFENIAISAGEVYKGQHMPVKMEPIVSYAEAKGKLRVKKVYADWSKKKFSQYQKNLMIQGFDLVHLPETNLLGKNGSDMRLVIDVMDHIQTFPEIDTVIIGSGDSDFIPLLQYLQSKNKEVVIIGFEHSVSAVIKHYCSEFRSLEEIIVVLLIPAESQSQRQSSKSEATVQKLAKSFEPVEISEIKKS
ncbi:MAG: NYN domain-containing protein [Bacteroidia bacterium]